MDAVKLQVELFAAVREAVGSNTVEIDLPEGSTGAELRVRVAPQFPALAAVVPYVKFAVELAYVDDHTVLRRGDVVAAIPPVSGG